MGNNNYRFLPKGSTKPLSFEELVRLNLNSARQTRIIDPRRRCNRVFMRYGDIIRKFR